MQEAHSKEREEYIKRLISILRQIDAFKTLTDEQVASLANRAEFFSYSSGETILKQGEPADYFYVMLEGDLRVFDESQDPPQLIDNVKPGELFGTRAFLYNKPRLATINVVSNAFVARYNKEVWDWLIATIPQVRKLVLDLENRNEVRTKTPIFQNQDGIIAPSASSEGENSMTENPDDFEIQLKNVLAIEAPVGRAQALSELAAKQPTSTQITELVEQTAKDAQAIEDVDTRAQILANLLPHISDKDPVLRELFKIAPGIKEAVARSSALANLSLQFAEAGRIDEAIESARQMPFDGARAQALIRLLPYLDASQQEQVAKEAVDSALSIQHAGERVNMLREIAPQLPADLQSYVLEEIKEFEPKVERERPRVIKKNAASSLGNNLRALRNSVGLTQRVLAERLAEAGLTLHQRDISNYETGSRTPDRPQLMELIQALVKADLLQTQTAANELLESANYAPLTADEAGQLFAATAVQIQRHFDITTHALSDAPTTNDLLGFSVYVEALAKFIEDPNTKKPITIAIDALWGMGKSSLMRMLQKRLARPGQDGTEDDDSKAKKKLPSSPTVWFNAWQYDQSEAIWANLVLEILGQVRDRMNFLERLKLTMSLTFKRFSVELLVQNIVRFLLLYALPIVLIGLTILTVVMLYTAPTLEEVWKNTLTYVSAIGGWLALLSIVYAVGKEVYEKLTQPLSLKLDDYIQHPDYSEKAGFLTDFQEDFKRVVEVVTQNGRWPLIIFIDDLDRCEPPKPVDIVEAINLLLNSEHCVFIIGMDTRTVASSIEAKYKNMLEYLDDSGSSQLTFGQQFLEKIVQIRFRIPRTNPVEFEKFINNHLIVSIEPSPAEVEEVKHKQMVTQAAAHIKAEQREAPKPVSTPAAAAAVQQKAPTTFTPEVIEEAQQQVQADEALFDKNVYVQQTIIAAAEYFNYNPRQVKRFINFYRLQAFIAQQRGLLDQKDFNLGLLGKWLILSTGWPDAVTAIRRDSNFISRFFNATELRSKVADHQTGEASEFAFEADFQQAKSQLDAYLQNEAIAELVDNRHLKKLLEDIKNTENIQLYLDLAAMSAEAAEESLTQVEE